MISLVGKYYEKKDTDLISPRNKNDGTKYDYCHQNSVQEIDIFQVREDTL